MADRTVKVTILGDAESLKKAFSGASEAGGKVGSAIGKVASIASGFVIGKGLLELPGFLTGAAQGAADDEAATLRLTQALKNLGGDMDANLQKVNGAIAAGQKLAFTDDDVRDSFQRLLAATGDTDEALRRQSAAMDLARGANIPLADATKMLGKLNEENVEIFKKLGITIGDNATEADALAAVQAKFGGQADAYASSTAGQFEQSKIRMAEVVETIGTYVLPIMTALGNIMITYVFPAIEAVVGAVGDFINDIKWVIENGTGFDEKLSVGVWAKLAETIGAVGIWVRDTLIPAFLRLVEAVKPKLEEFSKVVGEKFAEFLVYYDESIRPAFENIIAAVSAVIAFIVEHWPEIMMVIGPVIDQIVNVISTAFKVVTSLIDMVIKLLAGDFSGAWRAFGNVFDAIWDGVVASMRNAVNLIIGLANTMIGGLNRIQFHVNLPDWLGGGGFNWNGPNIPMIPRLADGGIVRARPGGTLAVIGEGGRDEAVVPLDGRSLGGNTYRITVNALDARGAADAVLAVLVNLERTGRLSPGTVGGA
ncbi:hypothetical protein UFOVP1383_37 [uncultured Caudovirales phage]|uniref:Uncharacterized protein n=1 Tax=uncultured Caudovirales phage TaxID=2100421 RepID=A0A6J5PA69_9CAUD|nr:hypothetical protein UFOVP848_4 [uncultured Caudovirales phage]CAB4172912.1 hypothetical protein UFOVP945_2 [uncultured Caudovirales phage]CAB4179663.1 hypothetical protein UFOVP1023_40 [uncultured Caudovirales phage]CAB4204178.1 hypothetical protein UFOVP1383_37 [uncultured Caudovirales phage]CAB4215843.1 hypothetical protein UFOVP1477_11 [uncultured Caudovirales phage]